MACTLLTGGGQGLLYNTLSIYVKPVSESLGIPRGTFSLYSSIIILTAVVMMPVFARLYSKQYFKKLLLACAALCACATVGFSLAHSVWEFYLWGLLFGLGYNGINFSVGGNIINFWFKQNKGFATGLSFSGAGFFAAAMISVLGRVIETMGWRWSYRIAAAVSLLMTLPAILLLLKVRPGPGEYGETTLSAQEDRQMEDGLTFPQAVRTPAFLALLAGAYLLTTLVQGANLNIAPALSDAGYTVQDAVLAASIASVTLGLAKIGIGKVLDRFGVLTGLAIFGLSTLASFFLLLNPSLPGAKVLLPVAVGLGGGGCQVSLSLLVRDFFGGRDFSRIFAVCNMGQYLGTATGASLPSLIFDVTGSYNVVWQWMLGATGLALALYLAAFFTRPTRVRSAPGGAPAHPV